MDSTHNDLEAIRRLLAELTARVYRIEREIGIDSTRVEPAPNDVPSVAPSPAHVTAPPALSGLGAPYPIVPPPTPPAQLAAQPAQFASVSDQNLESRIGSHWLNRIGISALLVGITYFLKFAFDNNWIGPAGRVAIGLLAGIAIVAWSQRFLVKGYQAFSYSLKAVGIGALYLSLWAAYQVYSLVPSAIAFAAMLVVTASTAAMAWTQDAELLAAFALTGGYATPLLLSTGENRELALFSYVLLLDVATLMLVVVKPWRRLLALSFLGTLLLYVGWYGRFYDRSQFTSTFIFASLFFAVFALAPLLLAPDGRVPLKVSLPALLAFANAGVYFFQGAAMIADFDKLSVAWFALALAAIYIGLSALMAKQESSRGASQLLRYLHLAVALGLITVAIPIRLDAHWITIGWLVESGVLLMVADRVKSDLLNAFALGALALGVARLLLFDGFDTTQLIFNMRFATYAIAVAVLGAVAYYAGKREDDVGRQVSAVAVVALNALSLTALTREVADYYSRQTAAIHLPLNRRSPTYSSEWRRIAIERNFTYSALWMLYGAMVMVIGFLRRAAFVRWQALALIAFTIVKVFIYDVSELDRGYRIVSFIVLGVLLLALSFVYQRDWLQLSGPGAARNGQTRS